MAGLERIEVSRSLPVSITVDLRTKRHLMIATLPEVLLSRLMEISLLDNVLLKNYLISLIGIHL